MTADLGYPGGTRQGGALDDHAKHCVIGEADPDAQDERTAELMAAVGRLMRRG